MHRPYRIVVTLAFCLLSGIHLYGQAPTVSTVTPNGGKPGDTIVISGQNFNTTPSGNTVLFGAVTAQVLTATATSLSVVVPYGATYAPVSVYHSANRLWGKAGLPFAPTYRPSNFQITPADFEPVVEIPTGVVSPAENGLASIQLSDVDGDGKADVIICDNDAQKPTLRVFKNNTTPGYINYGSFTEVYTFNTMPNPPAGTGGGFDKMLVGDLNGDGKMDIVLTGLGTLQLNYRVYMNTSTPGTISFQAPFAFTGHVNRDILALEDLDGDGRVDVIAQGDNYNQFCILKNTSTGGIFSFTTQYISTIVGSRRQFDFADMDQDGKRDMVLITNSANYQADTVLFFKNNSVPGTIALGSGQYAGRIMSPTYYAFKLADIDRDGKPDLISTAHTVPMTMRISRNVATSATASPLFGPTVNLRSNVPANFADNDLDFGDFDGDGRQDILGTMNNPGGRFMIWRNNSTPGVIDTNNIISCIHLPADLLRCVAAGDLDKDGLPDVAGFRSSPGVNGSRYLTIYRNSPLPVITPNPPVVCTGGQVVLTANGGFKAGTVVTYQWQVKNAGVAAFGNVANGGVYSGALTSVLTISNPPASMNGNSYRCVVSSNGTGRTSYPDTLTVNAFVPPVITDNNPVLSTGVYARYQWRRNRVDVAGAMQRTFTVTALGSYSVRVTGAGGCTAESDTLVIKSLGPNGIAQQFLGDALSIYPNPAGDVCVVNGLTGVTDFALYNAAGARAISGILRPGKQTVSLAGLPAGVYMMVLRDEAFGKTVLRVTRL